MPLSTSAARYLGPERRHSRLDVLEAVVGTGLTFPGLARLLVEWTLDCLPAGHCALTLKGADGPPISYEGFSDEARTVSVPVAGESEERPIVVGKVGADPTPSALDTVFDSDPSQETVFDGSDHGKSRQRLEAMIMHEEKIFGHIAVSTTRAHGFDASDWDTLSKLSRQFGFLLHHRLVMERAHQQAVRDELTGLYNRRYLRQALQQWIPKARRERRPISLLLLDVDHFKSFNDNWGHATGDHVLQLLGNLMSTMFRSEDIVCRYGGEEFAVLLCDNRAGATKDHPTEVQQFAERLRNEAAKLEVTAEDGRALSRITISGGIATFPWDANSVDHLLLKADEALYEAKRNGRNRIYFASRIDPAQKAV